MSQKRVLACESIHLQLRLVLRVPRSRQWDNCPECCLHRSLDDACAVLAALHGSDPPEHAVAHMLSRLRASLFTGAASALSALLGVPHVEASPATIWRARGLVADLGDRSTGCAGALALRDGRVLASSVPLVDLRPAWLLSEPSVHGTRVYLDGGKTPTELQLFRGTHANLAVFCLRGESYHSSKPKINKALDAENRRSRRQSTRHKQSSKRKVLTGGKGAHVSLESSASDGYVEDDEGATSEENARSHSQSVSDTVPAQQMLHEHQQRQGQLYEEEQAADVGSTSCESESKVSPEEASYTLEAASVPAATEENALERAAVALKSLDEALHEENPPQPWHVSGFRYLVSDQITGAERATPAKKVATLLHESIQGLAKARNEIPRARSHADGEVAIRLHQDTWVIHRSLEGVVLWVVLEQGGSSLLDAAQRVSNFANEHLPQPYGKLLADV